MSFTSDQLARLSIKHLIIHDVPNARLTPGGGPTLSQAESELDVNRINHLRSRLVSALGSKAAYDIVFWPETTSPVPETVRAITSKYDTPEFVERSQLLARFLYERQFGSISAGLLAVMDASIDGRSALIIMKVERQEGFQLQLIKRDGLSTFALEILDNLVLTQGTRLFKAAVFLRAEEESFVAAAVDSQKLVSTADDVAKFWLQFLGCTVAEEPRVRTSRFFETVVSFANEVVTDGVLRNDLYEHLVSELKSQRRTLSPKRFMEDYVPGELRSAFTLHFGEKGVPMTQFSKDTQDIGNKLKRRTLITVRGVNITAPVDEEGNAEAGLIEVAEEHIVVNDSLKRVGGLRRS